MAPVAKTPSDKDQCINLDDIRGRHDGRACVVLGAGPSLSRVDPRVHRHVTIAVNSAIIKVPDADYFCTTDPGVMDSEYWKDVGHWGCEFLLGDCGQFHHWRSSGVIPPERVHIWPKRKPGDVMRRSDDAIMLGILSGHGAANLAVVMGCNPIYLLGNDCGYKEGKRYWWEHEHDDRGRHVSGELTRTIAEQKRRGLPVRDNEYELGAHEKGDGVLGGGMVHWGKIARASPHLILLDCSGGRLVGRVPQATI